MNLPFPTIIFPVGIGVLYMPVSFASRALVMELLLRPSLTQTSFEPRRKTCDCSDMLAHASFRAPIDLPLYYGEEQDNPAIAFQPGFIDDLVDSLARRPYAMRSARFDIQRIVRS
jgi:hypothetical protein